MHLQLTATDNEEQIFVGIGPADKVNAYLSDVAHDEQITASTNKPAEYESVGGRAEVAPPTSQTFWTESASGSGPQDLNWEVAQGRWVIVVMNADRSPGVSANADVGLRAAALLPVALTLLGIGGGFIWSSHHRWCHCVDGARDGSSAAESRDYGQSSHAAGGTRQFSDVRPPPVALTARLDTGLSRWSWLIKCFLAIPHFLVLIFLWPAFVIATILAGVAIFVTGRYPRSLFEFNKGVLSWSWRVSYYAASGGLGTDQYPPFSLGAEPDYPATLQIAYPEKLSRGLVLVKWWLLAIPHYLILGLVLNGWWGWTSVSGDGFRFDPVGGGILGSSFCSQASYYL